MATVGAGGRPPNAARQFNEGPSPPLCEQLFADDLESQGLLGTLKNR